ncbi:hypothetical protein BHE74_00038578 [Ensete ventricosum]|nr:hypothetical protein BHE74_00038578 [Ensete ventricosum]
MQHFAVCSSDPSPSFLPLLSLFPPTRYEAPIPALDGDQRQKKPFKNGRREKGGTARERTEAQLVSLQKRTEVEGRKQPKIMAGTSFKRGDEDHARCSRRRSGSETVHARFTEGGCGVQRRGQQGAGGVASGRRFLSDTGAFADWVASSAATGRGDDLCLGFGAGGGGGAGGGTGAAGVVWAGSSSSSAAPAAGGRQASGYGVPADMGMVLLASAASFNQQHHHASLLSSSAADQHPIIPLLAAAPCLVDDENVARSKHGGIQLWQSALPQPPHHHNYLPPTHGANPNPNLNPNPTLSNYLGKSMLTMLDAGGILTGVGAAVGGGVATCQDCGNQAKKDCSHHRCRTCCKSRGFECSTHVKSTWVPATRRRDRQRTALAAGSSASTSKKPRLVASQSATASHTFISNDNPPGSCDATSGHQDASIRERLPGQVRAQAVFRCVRVTSIDDGEDQYAYHAVVKIGGRVFKGLLYGQGVHDGGDHGDEAKDRIPDISELHLGSHNGGGSSSSPLLQSGVFGGSAGLIGGANYGNQIS